MIYRQKRRCPKCDGPAGTTWVFGKLQRTCGRCGYQWDEAPLDSDEAREARTKQLPPGVLKRFGSRP